MLVLKVIVLILIREAAHPLSPIFLVFLLEYFDLDTRQGNFYSPSLASNDFLDSYAVIYLGQELNILVHVDVGAPAVGDPEEHLLEHDQIHAVLAASVMNPLLGDLSAHLVLTVEWQKHLIDPFH